MGPAELPGAQPLPAGSIFHDLVGDALYIAVPVLSSVHTPLFPLPFDEGRAADGTDRGPGLCDPLCGHHLYRRRGPVADLRPRPEAEDEDLAYAAVRAGLHGIAGAEPVL